jgi:CheY-like chemotaxis protein
MSKAMTSSLTLQAPAFLSSLEARRAHQGKGEEPFNPSPRDLRVLVLEDGESDAKAIVEALASIGATSEIAKDLQTFEKYIQTNAYDVASVDWDIGGSVQGPDVFPLVRDHNSNIGIVVYSVHAYKQQVEDWARDEGADEVVKKHVGSYEEYLEAIQQAARKGLFRRIKSCLRKLGHQASGEDDSLSPAPFDAAERNLYLKARAAVTADFLAGEEDGELMNLLKKRGWWGDNFDSSDFIDLPFNEKVAELLSYVEMTSEQLSKILEVDRHLAEAILQGQELSAELGDDAERNVDRLASVLSYLLRSSRYELDTMRLLWITTNRHAKSWNPPPWDETGLEKYLMANGIKGINQSLFWIRSY